MKYAYIAMIVIYLITFGCNPDKAEQATEDHGSATPATVEKPHQEEADIDHKTVAAAEHQEAAVEAVEQPATEELAPKSQWEAIAKSAGVTVAALMNADEKAAEQPVAEKPVVEEKQTAEAADSDQVVMPCGKMMAKKDIPAGAPCAAMRSQAPGDGS